MSVWGKIIGGVGGFAIGGPIGALIGAVAGHAVDKARGQGEEPWGCDQVRRLHHRNHRTWREDGEKRMVV